MKKRMGTIYIFSNRKNGMEYVGRTARKLRIRIDEEFAEPHTTACTRDLCRAIKRDPTAFDVRRVARCPVDQLKAAENLYIDRHNTRSPNGYNMTGGSGMGNGGGRDGNRGGHYAQQVLQHGGERCGARDSDTGEACRRKAKGRYDGRCHLHH